MNMGENVNLFTLLQNLATYYALQRQNTEI
jgi:hypothetical protein